MNNVRDFGAKGDGVTRDTAAVQRAIDAGGLAYFPPGTYLCGTLYLLSNGGLNLEPGAVLLASPDREDYNADDFCPQNRVFEKERVSGAHFIVAVEQHDVAILGGGRIDGNRQAFYGEKTDPDTVKRGGKFEHGQWRPGQMIYFCECSNVIIRDVRMFNAPYWTCFLHGCEDITISGVRILNDQRTHNGDGIDLDCCRRATVSDCVIDSGDDCITLRGWPDVLKRPRPCEHVTVSNCVLHTNCNAFRIGVGNGIVRNCVISNIVFHDTRTAICIVSNYLDRDNAGVRIENISFSNLFIEAERAFFVTKDVLGTQQAPAGNPIRNIAFSNVRGAISESSLICGNTGGGVSGISFSNVVLDIVANSRRPVKTGPGEVYAEWNGASPPSAFYVAYAAEIIFDHVRLNWLLPAPAWSFGLQCVQTKDVRHSDCHFGRPEAIDLLDTGRPAQPS